MLWDEQNTPGFNPQRGFMLLGTCWAILVHRRVLVSIPREDSCFWELDGPAGAALKLSFNPQRGFMLLGTRSP